MPTQGGGVCNGVLIANNYIMRNMAACHEQIVISDLCYSAELLEPRLDSNVFSDSIVLADNQARWFTLPFTILWCCSDGCELVNSVAVSESGKSVDDNMRTDSAVCADLHIRTNTGIRAYR